MYLELIRWQPSGLYSEPAFERTSSQDAGNEHEDDDKTDDEDEFNEGTAGGNSHTMENSLSDEMRSSNASGAWKATQSQAPNTSKSRNGKGRDSEAGRKSEASANLTSTQGIVSIDRVLQSSLLNMAYVRLRLQDPLKALEACSQLDSMETCTPDNQLRPHLRGPKLLFMTFRFLSRVYYSEALLQLGDVDEAVTRLRSLEDVIDSEGEALGKYQLGNERRLQLYVILSVGYLSRVGSFAQTRKLTPYRMILPARSIMLRKQQKLVTIDMRSARFTSISAFVTVI